MKACRKFIFAALAATAMLAGCAKEITPPNFENDKINPAAEGSRVIAVSFGARTKTTLDDDGLQPKFQDKDSILLVSYPADSNEKPITDTCKVKIDDKTGAATISTNLTGDLTALYPAKYAKLLTGGEYGMPAPAVQTGKFADANFCGAQIKEGDESATFQNGYSLFIITAPSGTTRLTVKSLKKIGEDGQRTGVREPICISENEEEAYSISIPNGPDTDGKYYVALYYGYLSDLSFEAEFATAGTGSIKGIPTSVIKAQADSLGEAFKKYNMVTAGTAYTISGNNWHEYVTVGGHKWATMNIGATSETDFGTYFSWGEIAGHTPSAYTSGSTFTSDFASFDFSDNQRYTGTVNSTSCFADCNTPYYDNNDYSSSRYKDNSSATLELSDDAANANWGGSWRMPTKAEFDALAALSSTWEDTPAGRTFGTSPNQIFLPAAGCGDGTGLDYVGVLGIYRSSSLDTDSPDYAYSLSFIGGGAGTDDFGRYGGQSVRAIIDESDADTPSGGDEEESASPTDMEEDVLL